MGFFKKFTSKANSALGLGKNNDMLRIGAGIMTGGASELVRRSEDKGGLKGSLTDLMMGKKAKDINPDAIANQIRATQAKGLTELNSTLDNSSGENIARLASAQQTKGVLSSAQDARRNAQKMMAQSGLQGSSLGLSSQRSIDQQTGNDVASINAQLPGQIRNQQLQDAQTRIQAGGINQNGMNFNKIEGQRSGGLLGIASQLAPIAGTIGGLMKGGGGSGVDQAGGTTGYSRGYLNGNTGGY